MLLDQKRRLQVGVTSKILRRILICMMNNNVWTRGQNKTTRVLEENNVEQLHRFRKCFPKKITVLILSVPKTSRCYREDPQLSTSSGVSGPVPTQQNNNLPGPPSTFHT